MKEQWKTVSGFEGLYEVSNRGRVKSYHKGVRILKGKDNGVGHLFVELYPGKVKFYIHRLVAIHFIENPESKKEVNHKDGVKGNNHLYNLEWATKSENTLHSYRELSHKKGMLGRSGDKNPASKAVSQFSKKGEFIKNFESARIAERETQVHFGSISNNLCGKSKSAGGFVWKFLVPTETVSDII